MPLVWGGDGNWCADLDESDQDAIDQSHPSYFETLPRYLTAMELVFERRKRPQSSISYSQSSP
jgi:hypothetical protein